ncbi:MAG: DUF2851 family protein, partial [Balneolaceae bacterium]|nr:DUF2851 family protein [Balneolaceae bacterium]
MSDPAETYHEELLHWIWDSLYFDPSNLKTTGGQPIAILEKGTPNHSDGPDISNARLRIDGLQWYGDIEFHWSLKDWEKHGHQRNPEYNRVIL